MKEPLNFSIDEAVNSLNGIFFWQEESEVVESDIQYSDNVLGVTGFLASEIRELKDGWLSLIVKEERFSYKRKRDEFEKKPQENSINLKYKITKKDGSLISISERISVIRNLNGKIVRSFGLVLDITDFVSEIDKLKKKNEELEQINSSKDDFISILSHDLRAPFTSILGFAEILLNETSLSEKDKMEYLKYIYDSSQNQLQLINYMLDWSRLQTAAPTPGLPRHAQARESSVRAPCGITSKHPRPAPFPPAAGFYAGKASGCRPPNRCRKTGSAPAR
jgi:signal transduction histidine kinase